MPVVLNSGNIGSSQPIAFQTIKTTVSTLTTYNTQYTKTKFALWKFLLLCLYSNLSIYPEGFCFEISCTSNESNDADNNDIMHGIKHYLKLIYYVNTTQLYNVTKIQQNSMSTIQQYIVYVRSVRVPQWRMFECQLTSPLVQGKHIGISRSTLCKTNEPIASQKEHC